MKKIFKVLSLFLLFTLVSSICFAAPKKKDPLDAAIRETSDYLNSNIAKGSKIVILNIQSDSGALSEYIIDELISNAVNDRILLVVDRQQLDAIRAEQNFQFSGEVDDKQALEIGKFFGAQSIISGAMGMIGKEYRLRIRALEVQTALVQGQFNKNIAKSTLVTTLIASKPSGTATASSGGGKTTTTTASASKGTTSGGTGLTIVNNTGKVITEIFYWPKGSTNDKEMYTLNTNGNFSVNQTKQVTMPKLDTSKVYTFGYEDSEGALYGKSDFTFSAGMTITLSSSDIAKAAPTAYRIGDTGPAGGIIFYDKKNNNGGWRYLEAAPVEAEFQAVWSVKYTRVESTQSTAGSGKRNTQLIVALFEKTSGEWDTAAQKCTDLTFGGFKDWYLPSKDELDQMYGQLRRKELGDFKNERYWSSFMEGGDPCAQFFRDGEQFRANSGNKYYVRPIRQVPGPAK